MFDYSGTHQNKSVGQVTSGTSQGSTWPNDRPSCYPVRRLRHPVGGITANTPKPLLLVGEIPFLDILIFELARHGIRRILLLAGFQAHKIIKYATSTPLKSRFGLEIVVSVGTATT